jgi:hypothetical protein
MWNVVNTLIFLKYDNGLKVIRYFCKLFLGSKEIYSKG